MKESTKSLARRLHDPRFQSRWIVGNGFDIGGRPDPLSLHRHLLPLVKELRIWDLDDGDAQFMAGISDESLDFVYSSHTLEHMVDPFEALINWFRILKPGGHLIISVPDEDLYEQGNFEEKFNIHHKHTFTLHKHRSWSEQTINVTDLIENLGQSAQICLLNLEDTFYNYGIPRFDQTRTPLSESAIEFVVRKKLPAEATTGRNHIPGHSWPAGVANYYEQYILDQKAAAAKYPTPFGETK
jgi:SAM-dependent methyltransferase